MIFHQFLWKLKISVKNYSAKTIPQDSIKFSQKTRRRLTRRLAPFSVVLFCFSNFFLKKSWFFINFENDSKFHQNNYSAKTIRQNCMKFSEKTRRRLTRLLAPVFRGGFISAKFEKNLIKFYKSSIKKRYIYIYIYIYIHIFISHLC